MNGLIKGGKDPTAGMGYASKGGKGGIGGLGLSPISTAAQMEDRQQTFYEENTVYQFDQTLAHELQMLEMEIASAERQAQMAAASGDARAAAAAQATIEAASIAAAAMREVAAMDNATKLQIAQLQAEVERERIDVERRIAEAQAFGEPINLAAYMYYTTTGDPNAAAAAAPTRPPGSPQQKEQQYQAQRQQTPWAGMAAMGTAGPPLQVTQEQMGGFLPTTAQPTAQPTAPAAVAGEAGPEFLQATPTGTQVTPITQFQAKGLKGRGVPGMAWGGTVGGIKQQQTRPTAQRAPGAKQIVTGSYGTAGQRLYSPAESAAGIGGAMYGGGTPGRFSNLVYDPTLGRGSGGYRSQAAGTSPYVVSGGGGTSGGGTTPSTVTPTTPTGTEGMDWQDFINQLFGNAPQFGWSGPTNLNLPGYGDINIPYMPGQQNVQEWATLPWQVQQGRLSLWRALGMYPETATGMMYGAAPTGIASPVAQWQ